MVWSLRHLPDEVKTVGTLLALDAIWRAIDRPPPAGRIRAVPAGGGWWSSTRRGRCCAAGGRRPVPFRMAKAARKRAPA